MKKNGQKSLTNTEIGEMMNWNGLQNGIKKAEKRIPKWWSMDEESRERCLKFARKTTKRCSSAIHGCGHRRILEGPTYQERRDMERFSLGET
jgi:hypothetical protein